MTKNVSDGLTDVGHYSWLEQFRKCALLFTSLTLPAFPFHNFFSNSSRRFAVSWYVSSGDLYLIGNAFSTAPVSNLIVRDGSLLSLGSLSLNSGSFFNASAMSWLLNG